MRYKLALKNTIASMSSIVISVVIGFILPRIILLNFGSEINGLMSSISQFLNYISILESGVGAVVVANLYRPISEKNDEQISAIMTSSKTFFNKLVCVYILYVAVLAVVYPRIINVSRGYSYTTCLVLVSGITLFIQYCFTVNYSLLLQAAQKYYIVSITTVIVQIINAIATVMLIYADRDIIFVKLVSSLLFLITPGVLLICTRKLFPNVSLKAPKGYSLPQKRDTLIHNLSYVIHNNTDIILLTLFMNIKVVSVYGIYNMIVSSIRRVMESFSTGFQATFGDMIAKNQKELLADSFKNFEYLIHIVATIIFTETAVMILPFVTIYTKDISDMSYYYPMFAFLLVLSETIYIYRLPYHTLVKAAGLFRETKVSAIVEAVVNIVVSMIFIWKMGIVGVAIGTLCAMLYRTIFYIAFFRNRMVYLNIKKTALHLLINLFAGVLIAVLSLIILPGVFLNYFQWIVIAVLCFVVITFVILGTNFCFFREDFREIYLYCKEKFKTKLNK